MSKVIVITGASSGIGEACANILANAGHRIILCARRCDRLDTIAEQINSNGGQASFKLLDVTSRDAFINVIREIEASYGWIDVLVNNAGVMPLAPFNALLHDQWNNMIEVNIKGVLNGIEAVLPNMEKRKEGHIINIASVAAHAVFPQSGVYCATKYAVRAISEGLRKESNDVRVTTISPGVVESELAGTTTDAGTKEWLSVFREIALKPESIAESILYAINQPASVNISEIIIQPTASNY